MAKQRTRLEAELEDVGFSIRTIRALIYNLGLERLEDLKSAEWGSVKERTGLATVLSRLPNMGPKGVAEVQAFREHGDARRATKIAPTSVGARLHPSELAALDAWATTRGLTRSEAVHEILISALQRTE